ncbi:hypothetical protein ACFXPA_46515 [Amycolatopsis sp. NPDC059090]|uniref:hypothetical protein n=1 Tax=unclassified Amycolatopsis TaxID=2618356 RepID=UPI003671DC97
MSSTPRQSQVDALIRALKDEYVAEEAVKAAPDAAARAAAARALARAHTLFDRAHANATKAERAEAMRIIQGRR